MNDKLSYTVAEASTILSVCRTRLYQEIAEGRLRRVKVGRSTRILREDISEWLKGLPSSGGKHVA